MRKLQDALVAALLMLPLTTVIGNAAQNLSGDRTNGKTLSFPADRSLGVVYTRLPTAGRFGEWNEYDGWERLGDARGEVKIPKGHDVRLDIGTIVARDLSPLDALQPDDLTTLWLSRADVTDDELRHIGRLSGLIDLGLTSTRVTDAGIAQLSGLKSLRVLKCGGKLTRRDENGRVQIETCDISSASAKVLTGLPDLERIDVGYSDYSDVGLRALAQLPKLRSLELVGTAITDEGIKSLRGNTTLQQLSLGVYRDDGCTITDAAIDDLRTLTGLKFLRLNGTLVTDHGVGQLGSLNELRSLSVAHTDVTINGISSLAGQSKLEYLDVSFPCGDVEARVFARFAALKQITGRFDQITDEGLEALAGAASLEYLALSSHRVTARGLNTIGNMTQLKYLWLHGARVDDQALRPLGNLKNLELAVLDLPQINGPGLQYLGRIQALRELRVKLNYGGQRDSDNPPQLPVNLSSLTALQSLESITLEGDRLEPASFDGALQLVRLKSLRIDAQLAARHITDLSNATGLTGIALGTPSEITDEGLHEIARLKELQSLVCLGVFTDTGLEHLAELEHLTFLHFASPFVTDAAIENLKRRLPGLTGVHRDTIGTDQQTLTAIRNRSYWPDDETVLTELDRVQMTLNVQDNLFRNGSREQRENNGATAMEGQTAPPLSAARWLNVPNDDFSPPSPLGHLTILHAWTNRQDGYRDEIAQLKRVQQRYGRFGVQIVSVHSSREADRAENALKGTPITWPCAIDNEDQTREDYPGGPYFLIGPDGRILVAGLHPIDLETAVQRFVLKQRRSKAK